MNKEKDFFKTCFNTVAGLEVRNESQAIAKEVVLSEIETLEQQCKKQKEVIDKAIEYINSKVISNGEIIDQLRKIEVKELLQILDKVKGGMNNE